MILVGFAEMVTDAKDFNDCYQKCVNAKTTASVDCKSGMFYYQVPPKDPISSLPYYLGPFSGTIQQLHLEHRN